MTNSQSGFLDPLGSISIGYIGISTVILDPLGTSIEISAVHFNIDIYGQLVIPQFLMIKSMKGHYSAFILQIEVGLIPTQRDESK